jgi:hypothetical protein
MFARVIVSSHFYSYSSTTSLYLFIVYRADTARYSHAYSWSGPLHYIDVHDEDIAGGCPVENRITAALSSPESYTCMFDYARDCANDWCAAGAIVNYTSQLTPAVTPNLESDRLVRESLMFLVHFVGDIHQPLHSARESDRGGNTISVNFNQSSSGTSRRESPRNSRRALRHSHHSSNLHSVWDSSIIEKAMRDDYTGSREAMEEDILQHIRKTKDSDEWKTWMACPDGGSRACTSQWGEESLNYALTWAYSNVDGTEVQEGDELSTGYYETRLPVVKERLAAAGVRLAVTLEIQLSGSDTVAIL